MARGGAKEAPELQQTLSRLELDNPSLQSKSISIVDGKTGSTPVPGCTELR